MEGVKDNIKKTSVEQILHGVGYVTISSVYRTGIVFLPVHNCTSHRCSEVKFEVRSQYIAAYFPTCE